MGWGKAGDTHSNDGRHQRGGGDAASADGELDDAAISLDDPAVAKLDRHGVRPFQRPGVECALEGATKKGLADGDADYPSPDVAADGVGAGGGIVVLEPAELDASYRRWPGWLRRCHHLCRTTP